LVLSEENDKIDILLGTADFGLFGRLGLALSLAVRLAVV
jgi:hypothetical protein